jgi:threonine dehydratase
MSPRCAVWGVEPEAGDDGRRSLAEGRIVHIEVPRTLADGAQTQHLGELTFAILRRRAAGVAVVSDAALVSAMRFFAERMKLVVEPTGALAAAAAFTGAVPVAGLRVGVLVSGGNVDVGRYAALLQGT